jgi:hypothetical protein
MEKTKINNIYNLTNKKDFNTKNLYTVILIFIFVVIITLNSGGGNNIVLKESIYEYTPSNNISQKIFVSDLLKDIRKNTYWQDNYKFQKWDCTNMSALISVILTDFGIENKIVCGNINNSNYYWHAMVKAKLDGQWTMIECTYPKLVTDEQLKESSWKPWNINGYTLSDVRSYYGFEFNIPSLSLFKESE